MNIKIKFLWISVPGWLTGVTSALECPSIWTQVGEDIGETGNTDTGSAVQLSADGKVVAIGARSENLVGLISVYFYDHYVSGWIKRGTDIYGLLQTEWQTIGLSADGTIVAGSSDGVIRVYRYRFEEDSWTQLGADLSIDAAIANTVSLSEDGLTVAAGIPEANSNSLLNNGHVRIWQYNNLSGWSKLGEGISGTSEETFFGQELAMSANGSIIIVGLMDEEEISTVRAYEYVTSLGEGLWQQVGEDIARDSTHNTVNPIDVSADGYTVVIGENRDSAVGQARVFTWDADGAKWGQKGETISGDFDDEAFGTSVSMSAKGDVVAVSAIFHGDNIEGKVQIYEFDDKSEDWSIVGGAIEGGFEDGLGHRVSLSLDGGVIATSTIYHDNYSGAVRIFRRGKGLLELEIQTDANENDVTKIWLRKFKRDGGLRKKTIFKRTLPRDKSTTIRKCLPRKKCFMFKIKDTSIEPGNNDHYKITYDSEVLVDKAFDNLEAPVKIGNCKDE